MTLMEQPILISAVGGMLVVILVSGWLKTGERKILYGAIAAALLAAGLLLLERRVMTDREQIEAVLRQIASEVERNDVRAALAHVHPQAERIRRQAENRLAQLQVETARITQFREVTVNPDSSPPRAKAEFTARVEGNYRVRNFTAVRFFTVLLHKEGDAWKVWDYKHDDFVDAFRNR